MKIAQVIFYDQLSGDGEAYCFNDNCSYYFHKSAIEGSIPNKHDLVKVTLYTNLYMSQIHTLAVA